jgi:diaminopimelate epimerase
MDPIMPSDRVPFFKMNGLGNQIVVADLRNTKARVTAVAARALSQLDAVPFDQLMEVGAPSGAGRDYDIRIFNTDGSLAEACGNGTRCVALWLNGLDGRQSWQFQIAGGLIRATLDDSNHITVDMGRPRFGWQEIPLSEEFADTRGIELQIGPIDAPVLHTPSAVNMGNPHIVFWVDRDVWSYELERFGPLLENHPLFPERTNVTIAQVVAPDRIIMRTWERGAGITKACGSAACATLVAAARKGLTGRKATLALPGGDLAVEWEADGNVKMTGPAQFEFRGAFDPLTGAFEREGTSPGRLSA